MRVAALARVAALGLGACLVGLTAPAPARAAVVVTFEAVDIPDAGPLDVWSYTYRVSGRTFAKGEGLSVLFEVGSHSNLLSPPPIVNADWDAIVLQPDPLLPAPGRYDAQAQVDAPSLADDFGVAFAWLGAGAPGAQRFEIYGPDFQTLETGTTVPVPEPASAVGLALGLACLALRARVRA
jgi:hypothetical protein